MTNDPSLMQIGTRNRLLHKFAASRFFTVKSRPCKGQRMSSHCSAPVGAQTTTRAA